MDIGESQESRVTASNLEVEATLVICAVTPERVADAVARETSLGDFRLRPKDSVAIRDVYLELAGERLRHKRLGVRVRAIGEHRLITFKGPARRIESGAVRREEFEEVWSRHALVAVLEKLAQRGVRIAPPASFEADGDPLEVMAGLGFRQSQERETRRLPRDVVLPAEPDIALAELVVDSVVYHFGQRAVGHHEVEVEVRAAGGVSVMHRVVEQLLSHWQDSLRPWHHGKRATGAAIEALLAAGALEGLVGTSGNLEPAAYDRIDRWFGEN